MTAVSIAPRPRPGLLCIYRDAIALTERIPLSLIQLGARVGVGMIFWQSAQTKLASWPVTLQLFAFEYRVPLIDPGSAAAMATAAELTGAVLLFLGLFARLGAFTLLGVVTVIQLFVYPSHWAEHLLWASALFLVLARGAGAISLDRLASSLFDRRR